MFLFVLASIVCVSVCSPRVGVVCSLVWLCGVFVCLCVFVCCFVVFVCSFCFLFMLVLRSCCFAASSFQLLQCIVSMRTIHLFVDFHCFVSMCVWFVSMVVDCFVFPFSGLFQCMCSFRCVVFVFFCRFQFVCASPVEFRCCFPCVGVGVTHWIHFLTFAMHCWAGNVHRNNLE